MSIITLVGSPRYPPGSGALLTLCQQTLEQQSVGEFPGVYIISIRRIYCMPVLISRRCWCSGQILNARTG